MLKIVNKFFGTSSERYLKSFTKTLEKINKFEEILTKLSDQELKSKTDYFKDLIKSGTNIDDILPEAFQ